MERMDPISTAAGEIRYMQVQERRKRRLAARVAVAEVPGATQTSGPIVDGRYSLRALLAADDFVNHFAAEVDPTWARE